MTRRDLIIGLVAAVLLLGLGFLLGHLASTTGDAERQRWAEENRALLGPQRQAWQQAVSGMMREAALASVRARALADSAAAREAERPAGDATAGALRRATDSLTHLTAIVASAEEAIPVLQALVASVTAERDHAIAQRDEERRTAAMWQAGFEAQMAATAALEQRIAADSARLVDLEGQLERAPKGDRWKLSLWGFDVRPGAAIIYGTDRAVEVGLGLVVTP